MTRSMLRPLSLPFLFAMALALALALAAAEVEAAGLKMTRYAQSCVLVEDARGGRVLVDPGTYNLGPGKFSKEDLTKRLGAVHVIVITHAHPDHFDAESILALVAANPGVSIYTTREVREILAASGIHATAMEPGKTSSWAGGTLEAVRADHVMGGQAHMEAFGIVIRSGGKALYLTSDTMFFHPLSLGLADKIDCLMLPMSDRGVTMDKDEAVAFARELSPILTVPIHYDSPKDAGKVDPAALVEALETHGLAGRVMGFGDALDL